MAKRTRSKPSKSSAAGRAGVDPFELLLRRVEREDRRRDEERRRSDERAEKILAVVSQLVPVGMSLASGGRLRPSFGTSQICEHQVAGRKMITALLESLTQEQVQNLMKHLLPAQVETLAEIGRLYGLEMYRSSAPN